MGKITKKEIKELINRNADMAHEQVKKSCCGILETDGWSCAYGSGENLLILFSSIVQHLLHNGIPEDILRETFEEAIKEMSYDEDSNENANEVDVKEALEVLDKIERIVDKLNRMEEE